MVGAVALASAARDEFCEGQAASQPRPLVAASVGPFGAMLADGSGCRGATASATGCRRFPPAGLEVLARSGADLLAFETLPCLRRPACSPSSSRNTGLERMGRAFPVRTALATARARRSVPARGVGRTSANRRRRLNCTAPGYVLEPLERMSLAYREAAGAYPNSGNATMPTRSSGGTIVAGFARRGRAQLAHRGRKAHRRLLPHARLRTSAILSVRRWLTL